jgi:hypothetical protein
MFEIFSSVLAYRIFDLLLVVVFFHCQYVENLQQQQKKTKNSALLKGTTNMRKLTI